MDGTGWAGARPFFGVFSVFPDRPRTQWGFRPGPGRRFYPAAAAAIFLIRGYQRLISPLLGDCCRFYPSCSQYAVLVLQEWGFFRGVWMTLRRLLKCGPWHEGGYDPPPRRSDQASDQADNDDALARQEQQK